jgi:hypothetical protein
VDLVRLPFSPRLSVIGAVLRATMWAGTASAAHVLWSAERPDEIGHCYSLLRDGALDEARAAWAALDGRGDHDELSHLEQRVLARLRQAVAAAGQPGGGGEGAARDMGWYYDRAVAMQPLTAGGTEPDEE